MRATWYVLEDGSTADPGEVAPDDKGVLRHSSGVAVKIGAHGNPVSTGVDVPEKKKPPRHRQVKAEDASGPDYKTR